MMSGSRLLLNLYFIQTMMMKNIIPITQIRNMRNFVSENFLSDPWNIISFPLFDIIGPMRSAVLAALDGAELGKGPFPGRMRPEDLAFVRPAHVYYAPFSVTLLYGMHEDLPMSSVRDCHPAHQ